MAGKTATLVLFDVDGTLIRAEGSSPHTRAFKAAFKSVFGDDCRFVTGLHGMTDMQIFMTLAEQMGLGDSRLRELAEEACRQMVTIYQEPHDEDGHYVILPGADRLVETLVLSGVLLGLVTGNTPEIARHKLASVGLDSYFKFGAFGSEAWDRSLLPPIAVARAEQSIGRHIDPRGVIVLGDTPRDVTCALDNGYRSVAVATGHFSVDELVAAGAELVLPDLQDIELFMRLLDI